MNWVSKYIRLTVPWISSESSQSGTRTLQPNFIVFTFPSCSPLLISFLNWPDLVQPKTNPSEIPTARLFAHSTWKLDPIQGLNPPCQDESQQKKHLLEVGDPFFSNHLKNSPTQNGNPRFLLCIVTRSMGCIKIRWVVASRFRAETKRKQPPQTKNSSTLDYFQKATSSSIVLMFMGCIRAQWAGSSGCQAAAALCWFSKLRPRTNQPLRKQPLIPLREIKRGGAGKTT